MTTQPPGGDAPQPPGARARGPATLTVFQRHVVEVVAGLEPGDVLSYGEVAREADHPGASQAVANVLRRVPDLPWWRVIPSTGRLYRTHAPVQQPLLESEGHHIVDRRLVTPDVAARHDTG